MKKTIVLIILVIISYSLSAQPVFKALEQKDYKKLEQILESGESMKVYNSKGLSPVWLSVYKNDSTALNLLIKYKTDLNFTDKNGMHPIMIAALNDSYECVKIMLENGVDVNWKSKNASRNQQPIRFASQGGSLKLIKLLLEYGANIESTPDDKATPLLSSIHARKFDIARYLFSKGANTAVIGRDGETVIHEAIKTGNPKMVELAIKYNAPLNFKDPDGKSTMQLAKQSGNVKIKSMIKQALRAKC